MKRVHALVRACAAIAATVVNEGTVVLSKWVPVSLDTTEVTGELGEQFPWIFGVSLINKSLKENWKGVMEIW